MSITTASTHKFVQPVSTFPEKIPGLTSDRVTPLLRRSHDRNVLYLCYRDHRLHHNYAVMLGYQLSYSSQSQFHIGVEFGCLTLNARQRKFFAEGFRDMEGACRGKNVFLHVIPDGGLVAFMREKEVDCVILDYSPVRQCREYGEAVKRCCEGVGAALYQVDAHNIVPAALLQSKRVRTADVKTDLRKHYERCLLPFPPLPRHRYNNEQAVMVLQNVLPSYDDVDNTFKGGHSAGMRAVEKFYSRRMAQYADKRNDVDAHMISDLSPWVHAGHISVQHILHEGLQRFGQRDRNYTKFVDEIHAWKSVGEHFVRTERNYDNLDGAQPWAKDTLEAHEEDEREQLYSLAQLAGAETYDKYWNAGQNELLVTGKMHGYVRIYWAKKLLQWSKTPREAIERAVYLNDTYAIDGNDPNGYLGIMWSMCGVMDSNPKKLKTEFPVCGRVLPMKPYRADNYVRRWSGLG